MNIQIKRNTFVVPGQSRQDVVQKICDIIVSKTIFNGEYAVEFSGAYPTKYIVENQTDYSQNLLRDEPYKDRKCTKIRTCEMRLALRFLQDAGYYVFSDGWRYIFTTKPQRGLSKAERQEFKLLID